MFGGFKVNAELWKTVNTEPGLQSRCPKSLTSKVLKCAFTAHTGEPAESRDHSQPAMPVPRALGLVCIGVASFHLCVFTYPHHYFTRIFTAVHSGSPPARAEVGRWGLAAKP